MKNKWSGDKVRLIQRWLVVRWPELFKPGPDLLPLALDIHVEILKYRDENPELSRRALAEALKRHTGRFGYLYGLRKNQHRYNLVGKAVQKVSPEHKDLARESLRQLQKQGRRKVSNGNVESANGKNVGTGPELIGERGPSRRKSVSAPVIVYKSPRRRRVVARPESDLSLAG